MFVAEKFHDALSAARSDFVNLLKFLGTRLHDRVERPKMLGKKLRRALADKTYAQPVNHAFEWQLFGSLNFPEHILGRFLAHALKFQQIVLSETVEVSDIFHHAALGKLIHERIAEAVNVHDMARGEMQDRALQFRGTIRIHTSMVGLPGCADYIPLADRTVLRHLEILIPARMRFVIDDFHDFGNHVAATLDLYPVADPHAEALDLVHVVQRGAGNSCAADRNRLEPCNRRQFASAAYLGNDVFDLGDSAAGRVLVGDSPTRSFARKAQFLLKCRAIDF